MARITKIPSRRNIGLQKTEKSADCTHDSQRHEEIQFQKGLISPAGFMALSEVVSVPDSSEIFSSRRRDDGALNSLSFSSFPGQKGYSDFIAIPPTTMICTY